MNEEIAAPMVRLIGVDGVSIGWVSRPDALARAREAGCNLVEVGPTADPPVCRMIWPDNLQRLFRRREGSPPEPEHEVRTLRVAADNSETDIRLKLRHGEAFLREGGALEVVAWGDRATARQVLERVVAELLPVGLPAGEMKRVGDELIILLLPREPAQDVSQSRKGV